MKWLQKGSADEDSPVCRASTHFHDPLKPWKDSYVTDSPAIIQFWCNDVPPVWPQYSNITWATSYESKGVKLTSPMERQDMNWDNGRGYFYSALMETDPLKRDDYIIRTFRAVGQVMHLLQDMAVPAHVRNDFQSHLAFNGIKGNSPVKPLSWFGNPFEYYVKLQPGVISSTTPVTPAFASPRLTDFWDTDNQGMEPGLAEFTNMGYYSDETIPGNNPTSVHQYAMPQAPEIICEDTLPGMTVKTKYKSRKPCPTDGSKPDHFVALSLINSEADIADAGKQKAYVLDKNVHNTYAGELIPRAVGYSAALLDYFFRGKLTATYNVGDITFRTAKITVTNNTPGEAMATGDVSLIIRYKPLSETDLGNKIQLNLPGNDYTYKVLTLTGVDMSKTLPQQLTFDLSTEPLPLNFAEMSMQVVYRGTLGNENGSVAVSEWVPIDGIATDFALSLPPSGVYAKVAGESSSSTFNELRVNAMSDVAGGLSGGSISLELEYRTAIGDQFNSVAVDTEPANGASYIYRAPVKNDVTALPQNTPVELVFDLPQLPVQATDVALNIVYTTANGNRYVGVRDISEPTPVDVYNNTDYSCIGNQWYVSGTQATRTAADQAGNKNGFDDDMDTWSHNLTNIYAKALSANSTDKASTTNFDFFDPGPLTPNTLKRLGYILTDYTFKYSLLKTWVHTSAPQDGWTINDVASLDTGTGFVNQADKGYGSMYAIRGNKMWWGTGKIFDNLKSITGSNCDWSQLPSP